MPLSQQAQTLADNFTAGLTADQRTNFNNALQNSPALVTQINAAVASGDLTGFSLLPAGTNAGGQYDPTARTLQLPAAAMTSPAAPARYDAGELTFVMGHEIQHAINRPTVATALGTFATNVNNTAQTAQTAHDYTAPVNTMLAANRNDESTANIAGYNATVGMLRSGNGNQNPSLEDIYRANPGRMQDVIAVTPGNPQTYALRQGYTLNADMTMTADAANTQAMGQYYYDMPANRARLGHNGDSNYQNYYAAALVGYVAQVERANAPAHAANGINTQLQLNMNTLGVNEAQLERNGLNLGGNGVTQTYFNTATNPPTQGRFDHTATTHQHVPIVMPDVPAPPSSNQSQSQQSQSPQSQSSQSQPEHPAVRQAMDALDRSPNIPNDAFGANRQNVATGIALSMANQDLRPDHVVMLDNHKDLVGVQGRLADPTAQLSTPMPINQLVATDVQSAQREIERLQPANNFAQTNGQPNRDMAPQLDAPVQEAAKPQR